jgi:uncharacterized protein (TIGR04255 family)
VIQAPGTLSADAPSKRVEVRRYANPPVHEVVLTLTFRDAIPAKELEGFPALLSSLGLHSQRRDRAEVAIELGPGGQQLTRTSRAFAGWEFKNDGPTRVIRVDESSLSLHAVRPGPWPTGPYAGWATIRSEMLRVLGLVSSICEQRVLNRVGVRYLNRIAVPSGTDYRDWLTVTWPGPAGVLAPYSFNLRQTWASIEGHEDLSATIGVARIEIPESETRLRALNSGVLLDIEVFNLFVHHAPSFADLSAWTARAHDVENVLFEGCITDALRSRLEVV